MASLKVVLGTAAMAASIFGGCGGPPQGESSNRGRIGRMAQGLPACGDRFVSAEGGSDAGNACLSDETPCLTIQRAIDAACNGDTIRVRRGVYPENIGVTKPVAIRGAGDPTIVMPARSAPNPCSDSALCGGAASSVFLIAADDVTISSLTIDGDNPELTSGLVVAGADLDARNGIVTDQDHGRFARLTVLDVTLRNLYLRGINAYYSANLRFGGNRLSNIQAEEHSIAIFNFGGSGEISGNYAEYTTTAFVANHSTGTHFIGNGAKFSLQGLHTDNPGDSAGSTADFIGGNTVYDCLPGGYGLFVFTPFVAPLVEGNQVVRCTVGLAAFGSGNPVTTRFIDNYLDLDGRPDSVGVLTTTDQIGFGANDVRATFSGNIVTGADFGFAMYHDANLLNDTRLSCNNIADNGTGVWSDSATPSGHDNQIQGNGVGADGTAIASGVMSLTRNYWGCPDGPGSPGCDSIAGSVDASAPLGTAPACTE